MITTSKMCLPLFQLRSVHCLVRLNNVSESVENALCEVAGLELPNTIESCGGADCTRWVVEDWQPCKCMAWHSASRRRMVYCDKNGDAVTDKECNGKTRPAMEQGCYSEFCKGFWRANEWREVSFVGWQVKGFNSTGSNYDNYVHLHAVSRSVRWKWD